MTMSLLGIGATVLLAVLVFLAREPVVPSYVVVVVGLFAVVTQVQTMRAVPRMRAELIATKHGLIRMQEALAEAQDQVAKARSTARGGD
jgi:hypothetical protein